ncbi:hypothetical protein HDV00_009341, partial [Rhizophlyctis rosea]
RTGSPPVKGMSAETMAELGISPSYNPTSSPSTKPLPKRKAPIKPTPKAPTSETSKAKKPAATSTASTNRPPVGSEPPPDLDEVQKVEYAAAIECFGYVPVQCLLSKQFKLQEWAVEEMIPRMKVVMGEGGGSKGEKEGCVKATLGLLKGFLGDSREKMVVVVLRMWSALVAANQAANVPANAFFHLYVDMVPALLLRVADTNPRVKQSASALAKDLVTAHHKEPFNICSFVIRPPDKKTGGAALHFRHAQARLELVQWIVETFGVGKGGAMGLAPTLNFISPYLQHSNKEVREAALGALTAVVKRTGTDDDLVNSAIKTLNAHQLQTLKQKFDSHGKSKPELGGKKQPVDTEGGQKRKVMKSTVEQSAGSATEAHKGRKLPDHPLAEEVESLKRQLGVKGGEGKTSRLPRPRTREKRIASDFDDNDWNVDMTCPFCNEKSEDFTREVLDVHFYSDCPCLMRCPACRMVSLIGVL